MINEALSRRRQQSKTEAAMEASQLDAQLCSTTSCRCGRYEKLLSSTLLAIYSLEHGRTERLTGSWRLAWVTVRLFHRVLHRPVLYVEGMGRVSGRMPSRYGPSRSSAPGKLR